MIKLETLLRFILRCLLTGPMRAEATGFLKALDEGRVELP